MHDGHGKATWAQTSEILVVLYNANRDRSKKPTPYILSDFNPYLKRAVSPPPDVPKVSIKSLKSTLMGLKPGKG